MWYQGQQIRFDKSYFSDRKQVMLYTSYTSVIYNGNTSEIFQQKMGVIQGSNNGTLFFDIYSNYLRFLCEPGEYIQFADDTCLIYVEEKFRYFCEKKKLNIYRNLLSYHKFIVNQQSLVIPATQKNSFFFTFIFNNCELYLNRHHMSWKKLVDENSEFKHVKIFQLKNIRLFCVAYIFLCLFLRCEKRASQIDSQDFLLIFLYTETFYFSMEHLILQQMHF